MATNPDLIHLTITFEEWKKLLVILEDCAPLPYYTGMANSMIRQGYRQMRKTKERRPNDL